MILALICVASALILTIAFCMVIYARWNYGTLEGMGIPVIEPHFILGSETKIHQVIHHFEDQKRFRKYGPVWGMYEGRSPQVYISDPELIKQIFVKDFDHFHDRRSYETGHFIVDQMMDILPGEKWKIVRSFMSPNFTTSKIKNMSLQIQECVDDFVSYLDNQCEQEKSFNVKQIYTCLTTDVIARCFFGTEIFSIQEPDNQFVSNVTKLIGESTELSPLYTVLRVFPFIAKIIPNLYFQTPFSTDALTYFETVLGDIINSRREMQKDENGAPNSNGKGDYVDLLNKMMTTISQDEKYAEMGITNTTVLAQAVLFLLAGFDTTALTFTMLSYYLATNPAVQEILLNEIDAMLEITNGQITHETIRDLPYLSACISETLRLCPPLIRPERKCMKDWSNGSLTIKKGTTVSVPVWALHYSPELYESPEEFRPERFLEKGNIHPYGYMPFGLGPRSCIGMRFALEEVKLTMTNILKKFCFSAGDKTNPVEFKKGRTFLVQIGPVHLNICKR